MRSKIIAISVALLILALILVVFASCATGPKTAISALTIAPAEVAPNQTVVIGANVLNSGTKSVEYSAILKINDAAVETKVVIVAPGETKTISFQYNPASLGNFRVDINGQIGSFNAVKPAAYTADSLSISPDTPMLGSEVTASIKVQNTGEMSGSYEATLKIDGANIKTSSITLDGGASQAIVFLFTGNVSGSHKLDINGITKDIKILKPAELKGTSVTVTPASVFPGQTVTIEATITNGGDVKGTGAAALLINGSEKSSQSLTLEPGASSKVSYTFTPDTAGSLNINVLGATSSLTVNSFSKYTSKNYNYTVSYPPDFTLKDTDPTTVAIEKTGVGGMSVLVDRVSTSMTAKGYFDAISQGKKKQLPDWTSTSQTEITENGVVIGYKYEYSNTVDGKKWLGKGEVIKKAGFGYYVVYTTYETEWEKNKAIAANCVDSFIPAKTYTGAYSNAAKGISLTLPAEWSILETSSSSQPFTFFAPYNQNSITAFLNIEIISATVTAKSYMDDLSKQLVALNWVPGAGAVFTYSDGTTGYEYLMTGRTSAGTVYQYKFFNEVKDNRAVMFGFFATSSIVDSYYSTLTQMVKSLVVSKVGGVEGVNRNEALFMLSGEIPSLDPAVVESGPGDIIGALFSGLVRIDKDLKVQPDLAESWKVSTDGKTYTFTLRKNAKFHDGRAVTAADVKYSWERACDPALKSPKAISFLADIVGAKDRLAGTASSISGIKIIDDYTIEVTIDASKPYFLSELAQPVAYVVDKNNVAKGTKWYEQPNGTGPFKMKSWQKDTLLILERNDNFYLEPAKLKNLVFKLYAGNYMQLYENGEIDMTPVGTTNLDKVLDTTNPLNKELVTGFSYDVSCIAFNVAKPPFDDIKIRQALAYSIDVNKIIEVTNKGLAERATGFVPPGIPGNNPANQPIPYDLEKAKQLIKESKYQSADKVPPITMYVIYSVTPTQQAIIGMWQALGLQVNTQVISDYNDYYARFHRQEFQTYTEAWRADYIDPQNFLEIFFQSKSSQNGGAYNNPDVDAALAKAAAEMSADTRIKMYQDIEKMVLKDLPSVPLYWKSKNYALVKPYVRGFTALPVDVNIWRDLSVLPH